MATPIVVTAAILGIIIPVTRRIIVVTLMVVSMPAAGIQKIQNKNDSNPIITITKFFFQQCHWLLAITH